MPEELTDRARWAERMDEMFRGGRAVVLVASAGEGGLPHLATAERVLAGRNGLLEVSGWLCPSTIQNVKDNPRLALVVRVGGDGVQVEGKVERIEEDAVLDGYAEDSAERRPPPQVRWILHVRPERFLRFTDRLHTDTPLDE